MQHHPMIKTGPQRVEAIPLYTLKAIYFHDNSLFYIHHKKCFREGYLLYCTPLEFHIVRRLMEGIDQVQTYEVLFAHVTPTCDEQDILALRKHMSRIKHKLPSYFTLVSIAHQGYLLRYDGPKPTRRRRSSRKPHRARRKI
ncbi:helix-turn-helix domain-containing protein [Ktedonospora formicarum]|uniref:Uncharacterized protein n=1 Tax=Ktedonospora formicarum TaxID=2778364 RepID=A0A8J3I4P4_9CHLR|nr:helix-turn-helix domain-containing protein [Ktedonospora formicarum]GHO48651.1 hypothetical protein KSX_68140 [Ktedonospora formicarum]